MTDQVPFPDLVGYQPCAPLQQRGPVSFCIVKSLEDGATMWVEELAESSVTSEVYSRIRRRWNQNVVWQATGTLAQRGFIDSGKRLTRLITPPTGKVLEALFEGTLCQPRPALIVVRALTACLTQWHAASRVHGGLNSQCIFVGDNQQIEIQDVEFLEGQFHGDFSMQPIDSVAYYAPESSGSLARDRSPASDLYSVGVLIFRMLAGRFPINASNASEYLDQQLCAEALRLRELGVDVPPALDDVVARLLRRDPRDRYETATGLLYDLDRVLDSWDDQTTLTTFAIGTRDVRKSITDANLVGREDELVVVRAGLNDALQGNACVQCVVAAEPSYRQEFLDEVALIGTARGTCVLRGGTVDGNHKPLQSIMPALSAITTRCLHDQELAERVAQSTAEHGGILGELLPPLAGLWCATEQPAVPLAYGSQRAAVALEELFAALAREPNGMLLLFDDLDTADDLTLSVIRSLVQRVHRGHETLRVHLIASGTSAARLAFCQPRQVIELGPIDDDQLALHLQSASGLADQSILDAIIEVADGDKLTASTSMRRLVESQLVKPSTSGWEPQGPLSDGLRDDTTIAESQERHISTLSPVAWRILSAAAVVGRRFQIAAVADVSETSYAQVLDVVNEALRRRLLRRDTQHEGYRFANCHVHEKLLAAFAEPQRQARHLRAAAYLERYEPTNLFDLARHYDAAGNKALALSYALQAAHLARTQYSLSVARDQLLIANRSVQPDDRHTSFEIWESLGEIELLSGHYNEADTNLRKALALANSKFEKARVLQKIGELAFKRGRFVDAATEYERALEMTGLSVPGNFVTMLCSLLLQALRQVAHTWLPTRWFAASYPPTELNCLQLQLLSRLSHVYWFSRHKLWTLGNHLRSLNMAEQFAPSATLAAVYSEHGPVMSLLRWFERANRYARQSLKIRTELGDIWGQGQSHHYHSVVMLAECRFQDAIGASTQAVALLRRMGDFWEMNMARYQAANAYYRIGQLAEATEVAVQMYESGSEIGDLQATGISLDVWARTSPQTLSLERAAAEAAKPRPDTQSNAQTQLAYAVVLLHHNRVDDAIDVLRNAIDRSESAGHLNTYISPCYAWLATALRRQVELTDLRDGHHRNRRLHNALQMARKANRIAKGFDADRAHCLRELALLSAIAGKLPEALQHLHASLQWAIELHQPLEEFATLKELKHLSRFAAGGEDTLDPQWHSRFDQLSGTYGDFFTEQATTETQTSNLSLADRFVTVLHSGRRIAQALSADVVYAEASEAARKLLRGQNVDVVTIEQGQDDIKLGTLADDSDATARQKRIRRHESIIRKADDHGQAVCDVADRAKSSQPGSTIAAPIAFRGSNVAVLLVTHEELSDLFGPDELRIADFVSTLAGAALENADGFLRLQQLNDTLEHRVRERTQAAEERAQQLAVSNAQLRETEEQLREAIVQANAANEAKGRFLATISHEIRTPLNGILGMNRLAREATSDERQTNYLDTVQESGESLLSLINDLLDVSKLESGKLELEQIDWEPRRITGEISRLMGPTASHKSVVLDCQVDPAVPKTVLGDPSRIRQILLNLVGNAIKFTERGQITVYLDFEPHDDRAAHWLTIRVTDTGIGIPADKIDSVFDSFSQVDSSTTRRFGGTGLGLAICRELTELMGGSISVESELGVGSEFLVKVPVQIAATDQSTVDQSIETNIGAPPDAKLAVGGESPRILVAEDGAINQEVIVGMLEMKGYEVVVANNGQEALNLASQGDFGLCLMDVDMPIMDGIEATRMIRDTVPSADQNSLPIIAMTAHSGDQIWGKCAAAGMNAYLAKPIDPVSLFDTIAKYQPSPVG